MNRIKVLDKSNDIKIKQFNLCAMLWQGFSNLFQIFEGLDDSRNIDADIIAITRIMDENGDES